MTNIYFSTGEKVLYLPYIIIYSSIYTGADLTSCLNTYCEYKHIILLELSNLLNSKHND